MIKIRSNFYRLLFVIPQIVVVLFLISCSDDTITPTIPSLDAARYDWHSDTISTGLVNGITATDTNNVLILSTLNLFQFDGNKFNPYSLPLDFIGERIDCIDRFNIFIGGYNSFSGQNEIVKWNGSTFENYIIKDSVIEFNQIRSIKVISPNDIWAGTSRGQIYHYDGILSVTYTIDTLAIYHFVIDNSNNLYCILENLYSTDPNYHDGTYTAIYQLIGNTWIKIYYYHYNEGEDVLLPHELSGKFIAFTKNAVFEFIPSAYNKVLNINQFHSFNDWGGRNIQNILDVGSISGDFHAHLFHYNGHNWSDEIELPNTINGVTFIQDRFFSISNNPDNSTSVIYKGLLKK